MADNILATPGTGENISFNEITTLNGGTVGAVKIQRVKPVFGASGSATDVSTTSGLPIQGTQTAVVSTSWTSATALNSVNTIPVIGMNTVTVATVATTTFTGGVLSFEVSPDNTNWFPIAMVRIDSFTNETTYTLVANTSRAWSTSVDGFTNFRVRLSTVIAGTGTLTTLVTAQAMPIEPMVTVGQTTASNLQTTATLASQANPFTTNLNTNISSVGGVNTVAKAASTAAVATDPAIVVAVSPNNTIPISISGRATGGSTAYTLISAATTNATSVKGSAGTVYGIQVSNSSTTTNAFLKLYNKASAPTVGTDTAVKTLIIPFGGGIIVPINDIGINFSLGIAFAVTALATTADTTAVALAQVVVNIDYV